MQTMLLVRSETAGAVYINGRLTGDVDAAHPAALPVSPFGAVIIEYRPFMAGYLPVTLRIPLSQGKPMMGDADDPRLFAALWPDGLIELEIIPEPLPSASPPRFIGQAGDIRLFHAGSSVLCESPAASHTYPLPGGASPPTFTPLPSGLLLSGTLPDSARYALVLTPDGASCPLTLTGENLSLPEGGMLRIVRPLGDSVGHALTETWAPSPQGWRCTAAEPMWASGAPHWPDTPEATAIAAVEAAQLGLNSEAASYFSPACPCGAILSAVASLDGCTPLRTPLLSGETAVGLMKMEGRLLRITPIIYHASPGGPHGWQIDSMYLPDSFSS